MLHFISVNSPRIDASPSSTVQQGSTDIIVSMVNPLCFMQPRPPHLL